MGGGGIQWPYVQKELDLNESRSRKPSFFRPLHHWLPSIFDLHKSSKLGVPRRCCNWKPELEDAPLNQCCGTICYSVLMNSA